MGAGTVWQGMCGTEPRKPILFIRVTAFTSFFSIARWLHLDCSHAPAVAGQNVGIKEISDKIGLVTFMQAAKVLPMSPV
jgi:hypothetical protein